MVTTLRLKNRNYSIFMDDQILWKIKKLTPQQGHGVTIIRNLFLGC